MQTTNKNRILSFYALFKYEFMKESMHGTRQKDAPESTIRCMLIFITTNLIFYSDNLVKENMNSLSVLLVKKYSLMMPKHIY
jgi:hypothetical protein